MIGVIIAVILAAVVAILWLMRYKKREKWRHWMDRDEK